MSAFDQLLNGAWHLLIDASWKALLLGLLAVVVMAVTRNVNLRHRIAVAAVVGMLLLPALICLTPPLPVPILAGPAAPLNAAAPAAGLGNVAVHDDANDSLSGARAKSHSSPTPSEGLASGLAESKKDPGLSDDKNRKNALPRSNAETASQNSLWPTAILLTYLGVTVIFAVRLFLALLLTRRLVRSAQPLANPTDVNLGNAKLAESSRVTAPLMCGVARPVILLPYSWRTWSQEKLRAVLVHEAAHARRGDWLATLFGQLNTTLFWFHPVAWLLRRQLSETAELCCDDAVIEQLGDRTGYAKQLLEFASEIAHNGKRLSRMEWPEPLALSISRKPQIESRIDSILDAKRPLAQRITMASAGLIALFALVCSILAASLVAVAPTLAAKPKPEPAPPTTQPAIRPATVIEQYPTSLSDSPGLEVDGKPALRIRVLDGSNDKPIEKFIAIAGIDVHDSMVSKEFIRRFGNDAIVNWQSHMVREGINGEYLWPQTRIYSELALRVEAPGYIPQRFKWIDKKRGPQTIVFRMRRDPGIRGQVILPNGKPAGGAEIGLAMTSRVPRLNDCTLSHALPLPRDVRDRWRRSVVVKADAQGRFTMPTESDPSAFLVAVHQSGSAQIPFADFQLQPQIKLTGWGRVEGTVLIGKTPTAGEEVTIYDDPPRKGIYPNPFTFFYKLKSQAEGKFVIEHFPAGPGELALPKYIPRHDPRRGFGFLPRIPADSMGNFHVRSGETTRVTIGGDDLGLKPLPENKPAK